MKLYEAVREYLDEHGIKQTVVASKAGINKSVFNAMMNGHRTMYADDFANICIALGVTAESFVRRAYGEQG